jgi:hypothetical protein
MTPEQLLGRPAICDFCLAKKRLHPIGAVGLAPLQESVNPDLAVGPGAGVLMRAERPYFICERCYYPIDSALKAAIQTVKGILPSKGRPTRKQLRAAYDAALAQGEWVEKMVQSYRGATRGRPRALAQDLAISVLFFVGISDGQLANLLGKDARYVKDRRRLSAFHVHEWQRVYHRS